MPVYGNTAAAAVFNKVHAFVGGIDELGADAARDGEREEKGALHGGRRAAGCAHGAKARVNEICNICN